MKTYLRWVKLSKRHHAINLLLQIFAVLLIAGLVIGSSKAEQIQFSEYFAEHPFEDVGSTLSATKSLEPLELETLKLLNHSLPQETLDDLQGYYQKFGTINFDTFKHQSYLSIEGDQFTHIVNIINFSEIPSLNDLEDYYAIFNEGLDDIGMDISNVLTKEQREDVEQNLRYGVPLGEIVINAGKLNNSFFYLKPDGIEGELKIIYKVVGVTVDTMYEYIRKSDAYEPLKLIQPDIDGWTYEVGNDFSKYKEMYLEFNKQNEIGIKYIFLTPIIVVGIGIHLLFGNFFQRNKKNNQFLRIAGCSINKFDTLFAVEGNLFVLLGLIFALIIQMFELAIFYLVILVLNMSLFTKSKEFNMTEVLFGGVFLTATGVVLGVQFTLQYPVVLVSLFSILITTLFVSILVREGFYVTSKKIRRYKFKRRNISSLSFGIIFTILLFSNYLWVQNFNVNEATRVQTIIEEGSPCANQQNCLEFKILHVTFRNNPVDLVVTDIKEMVAALQSLQINEELSSLDPNARTIPSNEFIKSFNILLGFARPIDLQYKGENITIDLLTEENIKKLPLKGLRENFIVVDSTMVSLTQEDRISELGYSDFIAPTFIKEFYSLRMNFFSYVTFIYSILALIFILLIYSDVIKRYLEFRRKHETMGYIFAVETTWSLRDTAIDWMEFWLPIILSSLLSTLFFSINLTKEGLEIVPISFFNRLLALLLLNSLLAIFPVYLIKRRFENA